MVEQITAIELKHKMTTQGQELLLLDVREPFEFDLARIANSVLIPLDQLPQRLHELDRQREMVVICHHGIRSQMAAEYLVHKSFEKVLNLSGGIDAWSLECDSGVPRY